MADSKITELTEDTSPGTTNLFVEVDMSGSPINKKVTLASLKTAIFPYTVGLGASNLVQLTSGSKLPVVSGENLTSVTAVGLSGTPALPNGTTATTQSANDNSTKVATTAYVDAKTTSIPIRVDLEGVAQVGANLVQILCVASQTFTTFIGNSQDAPTGASLIVVIKKNNVTVVTGTFSASSHTISSLTWASGSSFAVVSGDILSVHITQVGSTVPGGNALLLALA